MQKGHFNTMPPAGFRAKLRAENPDAYAALCERENERRRERRAADPSIQKRENARRRENVERKARAAARIREARAANPEKYRERDRRRHARDGKKRNARLAELRAVRNQEEEGVRKTDAALRAMNEADVARFNGMVEIARGGAAEDECWDWKGAITPQGYGTVTIRTMPHRAARVSLYLKTGELPRWDWKSEDMCCAHSCRSRACVNPSHLSWKTNKANISEDKIRDGATLRDEANPKCKVSLAGAKEIRRELETTTDTHQTIAKRHDTTPYIVGRIATGMRASLGQTPVARPAGARKKSAKISDEIRAEINAELDKPDGERLSQQKIANKLEVSRSVVLRMHLARQAAAK